MVLHQHDHGHSHGGHSHGSPSRTHGGARWKALFWRKKKEEQRTEAEQQDDEVAAAGSAEEGLAEMRRPQKKKEQRNINVHAAFIHVIGDLIQSVGVVIAAYIIRFRVSIYKCLSVVMTLSLCILCVCVHVNVCAYLRACMCTCLLMCKSLSNQHIPTYFLFILTPPLPSPPLCMLSPTGT